MYQMLRGKNGGLKDAVVDFTRRLIKAPSDSLREEAVANLVEKEMIKVGFDKVFKDEVGNVIGVMFGREAGPTVLFTSHMDSITEGNKKDWDMDPFAGEIIDGKLYGCGACDAKSGLAAQVYAGALLKRSLLPLQGNIVVAATVAEQNGLSLGTRHLFKETLPSLKLKADLAVMGEPTNLGLFYGHDGWMDMDVRVQSSNSFHASDAVDAISEELRNGMTSEGGGNFQVFEPYYANAGGERSATIRMRKRLNSGEEAGAVVTQTERRAMIAAKPSGAVAVSAMLRSEQQQVYTGKTMFTQFLAQAWTSDPFSPTIERARQSLAAGGMKITPAKWKLGKLGMGTSGATILKEFGVQVVGFGAGNEEVAHSVNEYVETDKIVEAVYGTMLIAHGIAGIPVCGWTLDEI